MKYIPSIAFEEMSGSAKGVTAAKVKTRKYIRNRGYGGSVRTKDQAKVKSVFKMLTTMWKTLSNEQILAWNKLALSQEGRSVLGTKSKLSGANLFTRLNYWVVTLGGSPMLLPPEINAVEAPSEASIVCAGDVFTFKLDQAIADNGGIFLVIEASEGQSNGVSRAHSKAVAIHLEEEPTDAAIDIRAAYIAKNGALSASAPKVFFRYYYVDSSTGVKSQAMLAECKWVAGESNSGSGDNPGAGEGDDSHSGGSGSGSQSQEETVAAPNISGETPFESSTSVTISGPSGAEIHYTLDGSTPTSSSPVYSSAIELSATTTVKAIAIKNGVSSSVASATFTKQAASEPEQQGGGGNSETLAAPVIGGNTPFDSFATVTITGPEGADIHYTTDGSVPTAESPLYEESFTLSSDTTVKAIAIKNGVSSEVATKEFRYDAGDTD